MWIVELVRNKDIFNYSFVSAVAPFNGPRWEERDRNPEVIIFAFVLASIQPSSPLAALSSPCILQQENTSKMSGSSNIAVMKKVVQQLRFEASINRVKVMIVSFVSRLSGIRYRYRGVLTGLARRLAPLISR